MVDVIPLGGMLRDHMLPAKSIPAETRRRLASHEFKNVLPTAIGALEDDGWVVSDRLKRSVKMRRPKKHDVAFEDRVWAAFAKLQFTFLNKDRTFRLQYGSGPKESKQIDVFAADDEVVLVVECKSTESVKSSAFKNEVEMIQGTRAGLIRRIKDEFPSHKIKFILATNNFSVGPSTLERLADADIVLMDEDAINYYIDLAEHLGKAARYQLLGALFAGQRIPGLESEVAAIQGKMGGYTYYSFAIEPSRLLKSAYVLHRNKANSSLMPTYQRLIKKSRLKKVSQFVESGGFFPNSIILNIDTGRRPLQFDRASRSEGTARFGVLHLPQTYRAAYVIDGQHRLYGYADSARASTDLIPVVAFENLPRSEQVRLFMQINENQQAVPKNLRNTLNADLLWESDDLRESNRALKLRAAQHLGEAKSSALYGRVIIGENQRTALRCITIDAVSNGLERGSFLGSFTKSAVKEPGTFYRGDNDATFEPLVRYLELALDYMRDGLESQWNLGSAEGGFVFINNGIEALIRVFSDIVTHLESSSGILARTMAPSKVFEDCVYYLDPLVAHLASRTPEQAYEYRRLYGSGGATRYWRRLQMAIRDSRPEFSPAGLDEFLADEAKAFNLESFEMIRELELFMNKDIRIRLQDEFGSKWLKGGVPRKVYEAAAVLAVQKNMDLEDEEEVEPWDCLHLIDYYTILTQNFDLWQRHFEKTYTRPGTENDKGGWKGRVSWIQELNRIRNENAHTYSVKEEEYDFLVSLTTWLIKGQSENDL
ncbi:DGQHR domain-containing protein [Terrabacter sp. GCM10028922]|uniref:DGQHR domain-containing protein n=1 Tax=Terrabacter sp. GCM10028922 TaxID=3273428 RepID=UPI0036190EA4